MQERTEWPAQGQKEEVRESAACSAAAKRAVRDRSGASQRTPARLDEEEEDARISSTDEPTQRNSSLEVKRRNTLTKSEAVGSKIRQWSDVLLGVMVGGWANNGEDSG